MDYKQDISDFLDKMTEKYGQLPRFAHNLKKFDNKVLYSGFYWDKNELQAMLESLLMDNWSINGVKVSEFERQFSKRVGQQFSLMTNSGSSSNLIALAGLKKYYDFPDDSEIIVSCCSFPTSVSVIPQNNLKPIFVDINIDDLNMDLGQMESKITNKTKAVLFAAPLGNPGDFQRLLEICDKHGLPLFIDNCDGVGGTFNNKQLNEYSIISTCSFFASHHFSCIQAGMVSTSFKELITICRSMTMWGRNCYCRDVANLLKSGTCKKRFSPWLETQPDIIIDDKYFFTQRSWNLQPLEFQGAIGIEQLKKWDEVHTKRRDNKNIIQELFQKYIKNISFPKVFPNIEPSWFGVGIITDTYEQKRKLVDYLENNNIQVRNFFSGNILEHPGFSDLGDWKSFPRASETLRRVFFIGCAPSYTSEHISYIENVLRSYPN